MTSSPTVRVEIAGPVTTVVIDRPEARNAVDGPTAAALHAAFAAFDADESQAVAVLTGAGGTFCAGADLKAVGTSSGNQVTPDGPGPMGPTRTRLGKPVVAAIEGYAVAGGLELAIWCDLRVVASDATFGVFCRRWGVPLIDGGTVRLPRLVGAGRAMDLILTGRAVEADEALRIGLADRVVAPGTARAEAEALALSLSALPQACLRNDRLAALDQWGLDEAAALEVERLHGVRSLEDGGLDEAAALEVERLHGVRSLEAGALEGAARFAAGAGRHGSGSDG